MLRIMSGGVNYWYTIVLSIKHGRRPERVRCPCAESNHTVKGSQRMAQPSSVILARHDACCVRPGIEDGAAIREHALSLVHEIPSDSIEVRLPRHLITRHLLVRQTDDVSELISQNRAQNTHFEQKAPRTIHR